jgi:hypothetical protein
VVTEITQSNPTAYLARRLSSCGRGRCYFNQAWHIDKEIRQAATTARVSVPTVPDGRSFTSMVLPPGYC